MSFRGKKKLKDGSVVGKSRDDFINEEVLTRIWDNSLNFDNGCAMDFWLHLDTIFPIFSSYFKCNFIWYGVGGKYTKASIKKSRKGIAYNVIITRNFFVSPESICNESIWKKRVICLYHNYHFMNIKEYVNVT